MNLHLDIPITDLLKSDAFTFSAEIIPPRNGQSSDEIFSQIDRLINAGAQYLAVTKGAGGSLRGGSLPLAQIIKERFHKPCIAHFTCRDLLPEEVENQLMDHHLFGIRNILALRGDPPQGQTDWQEREGSYSYAHQLVEQIANMNQGRYLSRDGDKEGPREKTTFCIGVACYPDHPNDKERVDFFERKVQAGAHFAISQMLFSADSYSRFLDETNHLDIPILPGTRILKSKEQARRMAARFQVPVDMKLLKGLPEKDAQASEAQSIEVFLHLMEQLKKAGAPGIHLFVLSDTKLSCRALGNCGIRGA